MTNQNTENDQTPEINNEKMGGIVLFIIGLFAVFVAFCMAIEKFFPKG